MLTESDPNHRHAVYKFSYGCLWNRQTIMFSCCDLFYLLLFIPRLIAAAVDWMSAILLHMVWP